MSVITSVLGTISDFKSRALVKDPLLLNSEERASPHMVGTTEGGRSLRISMERGTELNDGDVLKIEDNVAIIVKAAVEELFVIKPKSEISGSIAGYQLGNLHRPVRFSDDSILTPADAMVADVLNRLGIKFDRQTIPFIGQRYGSHIGDHHHGH